MIVGSEKREVEDRYTELSKEAFEET